MRPCGFMDIIPPSGLARVFFLASMAAVFGQVKQKLISCDDIGKAISLGLLKPEKLGGKVITIAGEVADMDRVYTALENASGNNARIWRIWLPRFLVLALSPYHYRQMFQVSLVDKQRGLGLY